MKKYLYAALLTSIVSIGVYSFPHSVFALEAELVSITPSVTDISAMIDSGDAPEGVQIFGWLTDPGTEYTVVLSVDESPAVVVVPGGEMTMDQNWSYDEEAGEVTATFTAELLVGSDASEDISLLALAEAVGEGEDGPPVEMTGAWLSTNVMEWELIPPSPGNPAFGYELTGPAGDVGYFRMFIPDALIDLLGEMSGEELAIEDLAVFNGDEQASLDIAEVEGGAFVNISVVFSETTSSVLSITSSTSVTERITVAEQETVSLTAKKSTVRTGKKTALYGWLKNGKKGKTVTVWRKKKGESEFTKWKTLTTEDDGYYSLRFAPKKTAKYKVKYNGQFSSVQRIVVE